MWIVFIKLPPSTMTLVLFIGIQYVKIARRTLDKNVPRRKLRSKTKSSQHNSLYGHSSILTPSNESLPTGHLSKNKLDSVRKFRRPAGPAGFCWKFGNSKMDIRLFLSIVFVGCIFSLASSTVIPIDNEVLDEPSIDCEVDSIVAQFRTRRPFYGRIFVKGHSANSPCVVEYFSRSFGIAQNYNATIRVQYGTCDVRRERSVSPRGVHMYSTIVIQFHSVFITKVDRSYRLSCFYKEAVQTVRNELEVSMLTTGNLVNTFAMPVCSYSLRQETSNGPLVRFAKVGDRVVHRWECQSPGIESKENPYGMLVHSCIVDDGRGNQVSVVDEHGCSLDPYILGHLTYHDDLLLAYREAHVFKFADQNALAFSCQIRLCVKAVDACLGMTPPKCLPLKNKRSADHQIDLINSTNEIILENATSSGHFDMQFSSDIWTVERPFKEIKKVCFMENTTKDEGCHYCQYNALIDRKSQELPNDFILLTHRWLCKPINYNETFTQYSLLLHSCYLEDNSNVSRANQIELIDKNGCEITSSPQINDVIYEDAENDSRPKRKTTISAKGKIEKSMLDRPIICQLRLCVEDDSKCDARKICKKRDERSHRPLPLLMDDTNEDVDVTTDRLLIFDTDDLQGFSLGDLDSPGNGTYCLGYASAAVLLGSTFLLLIIMFVTCSSIYFRHFRRTSLAQSISSSTTIERKIKEDFSIKNNYINPR